MIWRRCPDCDDWWCIEHEMHVFECQCPPLEEWETDPYGISSDPGPAFEDVAGTRSESEDLRAGRRTSDAPQALDESSTSDRPGPEPCP